MKFRLTKIGLLCAMALISEQIARCEETTTAEFNTKSNSPLSEFFKSSDEVVEVYRQRLKSAAESKKISAFPVIFGSTEDAATLAEQDKKFAGYFKEAGALVRVDA